MIPQITKVSSSGSVTPMMRSPAEAQIYRNEQMPISSGTEGRAKNCEEHHRFNRDLLLQALMLAGSTAPNSSSSSSTHCIATADGAASALCWLPRLRCAAGALTETIH
jgi:hypothetical protein